MNKKNFKITGKVNIEPMDIEKVSYLNELVERDIPMPLKDASFEVDGKMYKSWHCPSCDACVSETDDFCKHCGQRLDKENIAL